MLFRSGKQSVVGKCRVAPHSNERSWLPDLTSIPSRPKCWSRNGYCESQKSKRNSIWTESPKHLVPKELNGTEQVP